MICTIVLSQKRIKVRDVPLHSDNVNLYNNEVERQDMSYLMDNAYLFLFQLRGDRLPKYGGFFGKFPKSLDPPPRPFFEITLRFFPENL